MTPTLRRILTALNRNHATKGPHMAMRIRQVDVEQLLDDGGYHPAEWDRLAEVWEDGYRTVQVGPRRVLVFEEGPAEAVQLGLYQQELRAAGYHVHATQQPGGGRRRLEVTRA